MRVTIMMIFALAVAACNTVEGVGQDIQAGGEAIENVAK